MYLKPALEKTYADRSIVIGNKCLVNCEGRIKISIHEDLTLSDIEMQHVLHPNRADISIPPEIKDFISDNISLLPREIYIQLVERGLNGKNRSTFAWTELSKKDITEMTLISAQKWKCSWI
ncbi:hypothetical protein RhiirA5_493065 [Rhizophagus irregularis]|uniref:Uncharacterized protein n=1 Tax=Rhizophagus irregularis TaxID=588596 RepID=A0A2N0QE43_9GLOM|nr:hypothetical protein RhiirA5_493065 [Rhizophagus irregularis]PKC71198.1 hypothetical protein RhiirA1_532170 [Rhizophagus irregularis]